MDKTKYNRAAKDASQLQKFVDEACDAIGGSQDSLHVTVKDSEGEAVATFDVAYDNGDDEAYIMFDAGSEAGTVTFDSNGNAEFKYEENRYMMLEPETSSLYVGNSNIASTYHFMLENEDSSERVGEVMVAQNQAKEWVLGEQEDQLTLDSCKYQVVKIDLTNLDSEILSMAFPTETLAVEWNNAINEHIDTFYFDEQSHTFILRLNSNIQLNYIVVDLTNPLIAHVYAYGEM